MLSLRSNLLHTFSGPPEQWESRVAFPLPPKVFCQRAFFSKSPLNVYFLQMKINTRQLNKIKSTTLLLIEFYQVENIKSETLFNSIKDALG